LLGSSDRVGTVDLASIQVLSQAGICAWIVPGNSPTNAKVDATAAGSTLFIQPVPCLLQLRPVNMTGQATLELSARKVAFAIVVGIGATE
jgi:hypothetical protein